MTRPLLADSGHDPLAPPGADAVDREPLASGRPRHVATAETVRALAVVPEHLAGAMTAHMPRLHRVVAPGRMTVVKRAAGRCGGRSPRCGEAPTDQQGGANDGRLSCVCASRSP